MHLLTFLQTSPGALVSAAAVLGLIVGSFLNVVILRLPVMLERDWRREATEILASPGSGPDTAQEDTPEQAADTAPDAPGATGAHAPVQVPNDGVASDVEAPRPEPFNLVRPPSRCEACGHRIGVLENVPVLSYLWLRGRCSACSARISPRYPLVEVLSGVLAAVTVWHFGFGPSAAAALLLTWSLIALAFIDLDTQYLPDCITLPGLWVGLMVNLGGTFAPLAASVIGAVAGYLFLWLVYHGFRLATGKEGMGFGDFKLLAMLGAWLGWSALPTIVLLASVVGSVTGLVLLATRRLERGVPIPFGPFLAAAGWLALVWGADPGLAGTPWGAG